MSNKIIFGCAEICSKNSLNRALEILHFAKNLGIKYFDTASSYGNGYSELLVGLAFKDDNNIRITTKIGNQPSYVTKLPIETKLCLNKTIYPIKKIKRFSLKYIEKAKSFLGSEIEAKNYENKTYPNTNHLVKNLSKSLKRINSNQIDTILFHEIHPFFIDDLTIKKLQLILGINKKVKLGYGGTSQENILDISPPRWLNTLQIKFPNYHSERKKLFNFIDKYPDIEIRLFGIFRGDIKNKMLHSKKMLDNFPNIKVVFQTDSTQRIASNYDYFMS